MAYTLSHNTPSTGYISWSDVDIIFDGVTYPVESGQTSDKYVYWLMSSPLTLHTSKEYPTLSDEDCLVFINNGGAGLSVLDATVMDGSIIVPGTIQGDAIMAEAIVGSHIAANAIVGVHIAGESITGDKIVANSITATQIDSRGLSIKDEEGNIILSAGNIEEFANSNVVIGSSQFVDDKFVINSDKEDKDVSLVFDRTSGGSANFVWNGTKLKVDKAFEPSKLSFAAILSTTEPDSPFPGQVWIDPSA